MFKKNLKTLSLFLILLVLMIGAISAVSAANVQDVGYSDITIADASDINVTQDITELDTAASEADDVEVTIVTEGTSSGSSQGVYVPDGTPIMEDNADVKFDGKVYVDDEGTNLENVVVKDNVLTGDAEGTFVGTLEITDGAETLVDGETYYAGILVPAGSQALYLTGEGILLKSTVKEDTVLYVPFTYVSLYEVEITEEPEEIDYGDDISYNGTVTANTEIDIPDNAGISVVFTDADKNIYTIADGDITFKNGEFVIDNVEKVLDEDKDPVTLPAGVYTVVVALYTTGVDTTVYAYDETILFVNGINVTLAAELDDDVVEFDGPATLTVVIGEEIDMVLPTVTVKAINQATGVIYDIDGLTYDDEDDVFEGEMTWKDGDELPVGTYLVTVSATLDNYAFNSVALNYTVEAAETEIDADPNPVYVVDGEDATIDFDVLTENTPLGIVVGEDTIIAVLRDEDGNAVKALDVDYNEYQITVDGDDVEDGYYVSITYTGTSGYEADSVNVPLFIREGTLLTATPETAEFNYGEKGPVVTIKLTDKEGEVIEINTTVIVSIDDIPIDTEVALIDGVGKLNLTDLGLDADKYVVTFTYVDEDDVYMPAEDDVLVTVYPIQSYILNVDEDEFTYNVNSDDTVDFYLTLSTNSTVIADYTGNLSYYIDGDIDVVYTIPVVDGVASIPVSELEGLVYDADDAEHTITYTFFVDGNEVSNEVDVDVTIELLNGEILTENVTAYEDTGFIIDGFVTNVTGGKVSVALMDDIEDDPFAVVFADVDEETGYFAASFGGLPEGNYTAGFTYLGTDATIPAKEPIYAVADVIVSGEAPEPTNVSYATVLTIDPFNETEGAGKSLVGRLTLEDGTPVVGMHILLNLTRVSDGASKVYTTTTDYNGEFQFPINLGAGEYTAQATFEGVTIPSTNVTYNASESPVTPFSVTKNGTQPTNETSVIITTSPYVGTYGTVGNFTAKFTNNAGQPLVGYPVGTIEVTLTRVSSGASKTYSYFVTDYNGEITMPIELAPGQYTADIKFKGSTVPAAYDPAEVSTTLTVNRA